MSRRAFAERSGLTPSVVSSLEGGTVIPDSVLIKRLADGLGITIQDFSSELEEADWRIDSGTLRFQAEGFWEDLGLRLLHPVQVLILEAIAAIGQPLSPTQLLRVFNDKSLTLALLSYHCRRLVALEVLQLAWQVPVRGAVEHFYTYSLFPLTQDA